MDENWEAFFTAIGNEPEPSLYRVFKSTIQRVPPLHSSLNSHACYFIVVNSASKIAAWIGQNCSKTDSTLLNEVIQEIFLRDFGDKSKPVFPILVEGKENLAVLERFLDIIWAAPSAYTHRVNVAERRTLMHNTPVSIGLLAVSKKADEKFVLQETSFAHPDANGAVPRVTFPNVEQDSIVFMSVGDQWDLWFARGVTAEQRKEAMTFVQTIIENQVTNAAEDPNTINRNALKYYISTIEQGDETVVFRRPIKIFTDFEPAGRTLPRTTQRTPVLKPAPTVPSAGNGVDASKGDEHKEETVKRAHFLQLDDEIEQLNIDEKEFNRVDFWHDVKPARDRLLPARSISIAPSRLDSSSGAFVVAPAMLETVEQENLGVERRRLLLEESSSNPAALIGWQVCYSSNVAIVGS